MLLFFVAIPFVAVMMLLIFVVSSHHKRTMLEDEIALLRARSEELAHVVDLDDLTPAQSRRYLSDRIDRTKRTELNTLLFVDLDDFKSVNDGYGHEVGDALLIKIAQAMVDTCRDQDFVARLGGDEFCVFLGKCNLEQAKEVAERFRATVAATSIHIEGVEVHRTASIGISELRPAQSMVDALYIADAALYEAKVAGRNQIQGPDEGVLKQLKIRQAKPTSEEVARAMSHEEITYFVQPIFDTTSHKAIGVEALLRWVTPDGQVRLPEYFFDTMAANYRLNIRPPIEAANTLANTFTSLDPPLFCAWNISSSFLGRMTSESPGWLDDLLFGVSPELTVFEIVESAVIKNPDHTKRLLASLREAGVRVALDDFGTGFSNLERLMEYPVDIVKIDRSFIHQLGQGNPPAILEGLVSMSQTMGFDIIAEGVENQQQLDILQDIGIHKVQGFFLGRPGPVSYWHQRILDP